MTRTKKITLSVLAVFAIGQFAGATTTYAFGPEGGYKGMSKHGAGMHKGMHGGKKMFKKLDADKDGIVTRQEAEDGRDKHFTKMDKDKDGIVSVAEIDGMIEKRLRRMQVRMRYKMLAKLDSNGDGQIDKEEFDEKTQSMFERADANGDGEITRKEARKMHRGRGMKRYGYGHRKYRGHGYYKQGNQKQGHHKQGYQKQKQSN